MTSRTIDRDKVRQQLRGMPRGKLLIIAERAIELVSAAKLSPIVRDYIKLEESAGGARSLLNEVRTFHAASLRGDFFENFSVDFKNYTTHSKGTDEFIAELSRLIEKCIRAAKKKQRDQVRDAFDLLFGLLRKIDKGDDELIFFADEGGSSEMDVNWHDALSAYFRCLADTATPENFAREVNQAINDFAHYRRPHFIVVARRIANAEQKAALRALPKSSGRHGHG